MLGAALLVGTLVALGAGACSSDENTVDGTGLTPNGGSAGAGGGTGATAGAGGATGCTSSDGCTGTDVCVGGVCCASDKACASSCCGGADVCLFDQCVTPGGPCHTANDCLPGQYCETALGDNGGSGGSGSGGSGSGGGPVCSAPVPLEGRCLDLPPECDANGQPPGCVPICEYHPPPGMLNAVPKWTWGPTGTGLRPNFTDVWSTPAVGRVYDANCDGAVDELDPPDIIFVSGRGIHTTTGVGTCCQCTGAAVSACLTGVLRMLDGRSGAEIWSLDTVGGGSVGFAGLSTAIGDIDGDGRMDILAVTGEGYVVMVTAEGQVVRTSDLPIPGHGNATFGWGGGLAIADMDHDGFPEIAYGATVYATTNGAITLLWTGTGGIGGGQVYEALSTFVDLDGDPDGNLELLAGRTAYRANGSILWDRPGLTDGFSAVGNLDLLPGPEVVLVAGGQVRILAGATGANLLGPVTLPGTGFGGPPTVADFDGDGLPEIGVAQATFYSMLKPDFAGNAITIPWATPNHDLSSSVTGSSVFDFEGDGKAEVIYADECFLWVFDGQTGAVRFATSHTSFTATEASLLADVDGDGHADILMVSNGADPSAAGWACMNGNGVPVTVNGHTWVPGPTADQGYRGLAVFGDAANSWVGTRTLWNQHTYHVTNVCDDRDSACVAPNVYGSIPQNEQRNWTLGWLNNFRQNVQDGGLFDAADATVSLAVDCTNPVLAHVSVRNQGMSSLPAGVVVGIFAEQTPEVQVAEVQTTHALFPGQTEVLVAPVDSALAGTEDTYLARILVDPLNPTFHQCREDNDESAPVTPSCVQ
ncbi:MAG: VCBS repeat-containing protein [Myxococcales bacterium]|nr:VCBS repeat-containing protein [Myxococcales bacterium]